MAFTIPLDADRLRGLTASEAESRLQRIVGAVEFQVLDDRSALHVLAPAAPYHASDPFLTEGLSRLQRGLRLDDALFYHVGRKYFDLCLEDSWSGHFLAQWVHGSASDEDVVFIHLDDHTDMMPSLLERREELLVDPASGRVFNVLCGSDWHNAITSASVGIGSFVNTLFYLPNRFHVRHVNNYANSDYTSYSVRLASQRYPETMSREFAAVRKTRASSPDAAGSYRGGPDPAVVLSNLPLGRVAVHIDLDYLINDFNGNPRPDAWQPSLHLEEVATRKLDAFFDALLGVAVQVDRWLVATSPGFCSACHWGWLLEQIEQRIERVTCQAPQRT